MYVLFCLCWIFLILVFCLLITVSMVLLAGDAVKKLKHKHDVEWGTGYKTLARRPGMSSVDSEPW